MQKRMMKVLVLCAFTLVFSTGCMTKRHLASPYSQHYDNNFKNVQLPDIAIIQNNGTVWTFSKPIGEVLEASLKVVSQYKGILGIDTSNEMATRILFVNGNEKFQVMSAFGAKNKGMQYYRFQDVWIAVAISSENGGESTTVAASWVSPTTGEVAPLEVTEQENKSEVKIAQAETLVSSTRNVPIQNFDQFISALSDANARKQIALTPKNSDADAQFTLWKAAAGTQSTRRKTPPRKGRRNVNISTPTKPKPSKFMEIAEHLPQATINEFFFHLATQMYGPSRWRGKFIESSQKKNRSQKEIKGLEKNTDFLEHAQMEKETGNWASLKLRRTFIIVESPEVHKKLKEIADQIKIVAKEEDKRIKVYILASPEINAFALPNGDIFILSGMLEALDTIDEVAAVMGHELDHFFQHDTTTRLKEMRTARGVAMAIGIVGGVAGGVGGVLAGGTTAVGVQSVSSQITQSVVQNTITNLTGQIGSAVGATMVSGHSQESELRADYNGARYLYAAGYDVEAEISLLLKLRDVKSKADKRKEVISSGFINAQPGLERRMEEMKGSLGNLEDLLSKNKKFKRKPVCQKKKSRVPNKCP